MIYVRYLWYLVDSEQKINKIDIVENKQFNFIKQQDIKEFCIDYWEKLWKNYITKLQAFVYNTFDYIKQIYIAGGYNSYKKTNQ